MKTSQIQKYIHKNSIKEWCQALTIDIIAKNLSIEKIIEKAGKIFCVDRNLIINGKNIRGSKTQKATIYFVQRYCVLRNEETDRLFGETHCKAISKISARFKEKLTNNKKLANLARKVELIIKT
ncbi:MAG: hypothetical protein B6D56_01005 [Candidatus Omnitrophica bacterium 4484_70.1]|nr:MAG: hypothetical protein B6D56_01005 [Candidatus Omnitrophica bacterium 4484_70.1]